MTRFDPPHAETPLEVLDKQCLIEVILWQRDYVWRLQDRLEKAAKRAGAHRKHLREMQRACRLYRLERDIVAAQYAQQKPQLVLKWEPPKPPPALGEPVAIEGYDG